MISALQYALLNFVTGGLYQITVVFCCIKLLKMKNHFKI